MAVITITLWDRHITAQAKVNGVLWAVGMLTMASVIALLIEIGYAAIRRGDDLLDPITERLKCVEQLLRDYANGHPVDAAMHSRITRFAMLGTSRLRILSNAPRKARIRPGNGRRWWRWSADWLISPPIFRTSPVK